MRTLALAVCLILPALASAGEADALLLLLAPRAKAAPVVAPVCNCTSPADCTCAPGQCTCPNCQHVAAPRNADPYESACAEAVRLGLPVVVFVGVPAQRGSWVSCAVPAGWGDWFPSGKGIIVSRNVMGVLYRHCDLDSHATANDIRLSLAPPPPAPVPPPVSYAPAFAPMQFAAPMFGGGRGRSC